MYLLCSDLEGIFVPEVWIAVAENTGVEELRLTTRDIPDYNVLMKRRLAILKKEGITIMDIQRIINLMNPLEGALEFLEWIRDQFQIILVSDTFVEFADPFLKKLNRPTLFCNSLVIDCNGTILDYKLRQDDGKRHVIKALKSINYTIIAIGDSYNDTTMLGEAHRGILFRPPKNVKKEFPQFPSVETYEDLKTELIKITGIRN